MKKIVIGLHIEPGFRSADTLHFQPNGQLFADRRPTVQDARQWYARYTQFLSRCCDRQTHFIKQFQAEKLAGVWRIVHHFSFSLSMIIQIIDQFDVASGKAEHNPPVAVHPNRPKAAHLSFELVALERLQGDRLRAGGDVENSQNQPQLGRMGRLDAFGRTCLVKQLKPFMSEAYDHAGIVSRGDTNSQCKNPLPSTHHCRYSGGVTEKNVTGLGSLNNQGGRAATVGVKDFSPLHSLAAFLRPRHRIASFWVVMCGEPQGSPVPWFRSANPYIAALFAFGSAMGGSCHLNQGAMP